MAQEESKPEDLSKWEGTTRVELKGAKPEQVWPLLEDFCNLHKIFPCIDTCYYLEGELGNPGMIRYCAAIASSFESTSLNDDDDHDDKKSSTKWAKEKLLSINPGEKWLSYEVLENNVGFKSYVSTIKVLPNDDVKGRPGGDGGDNEEQGCLLEWSFVSDPIDGWRAEDFDTYVHSSLQSIANRIQEILQTPAN